MYKARLAPLFLILLIFYASPAKAKNLQVLAATSLTDALIEIAPVYEKESGNKLYLNFAGSNVLARQIREGAPADVFISADEIQMDTLQKSGLIIDDSRQKILSNTLVIVAKKESLLKLDSPEELTRPFIKRLALADPNAVPAGVYAREYLEKLGLWNALKKRIIPTENVRAALAAVESGNVDAGIVYKTDASISKAVKILYEVPTESGPSISYSAAIVKSSKQLQAAEKFMTYLQSEPARKVFRKFHFLISK